MTTPELGHRMYVRLHIVFEGLHCKVTRVLSATYERFTLRKSKTRLKKVLSNYIHSSSLRYERRIAPFILHVVKFLQKIFLNMFTAASVGRESDIALFPCSRMK